MKRALRIAAGLVLVVVCAAAGVWGAERVIVWFGESRAAESAGPQPTRVGVVTPEMREMRDSFEAIGTILSARSIALRPLTEGRVADVAVSSGESVEEGQLLFAFDDRAERAELAEARATLAEAEANFRRIEELAGENVAADAQLEEARAAFRRAEAAVAMAEAALEDQKLFAPFAGVLGLIDLDRGEMVDPETMISTLDDISTVQADFAIPERYFDIAAVGQTVILDGAVYEDRSFEGEVTVKAPRIDPASRSFVLRVAVENDDRALTYGMFVNATLVFQSYQALTVPDDAVISEGDVTYVYLVRDGAAMRVAVRVGARRDGRTEIVEGLSAGDRVVVTGYDTLSDGAPVEVAEEAPSAEALN